MPEEMFTIDKTNSDEQYLYVDVSGRGTVVIKAEDEGIVIDVYPKDPKDGDEPVATTWAHMSDLLEESRLNNPIPFPPED
jgi:hypothetical protein